MNAKEYIFGNSRMYEKIFKRWFDFVFSLLLLIVVAIPMVIVAIGIKSTSKGPVLFRQKRYGVGSKPFVFYKFRSMSVDAPIISALDGHEKLEKHITPLGSFLRASSIDELPQLFNILMGQMSFIGPRPLAETDIKTLELRKKFGADKVKPGISGLAQVSGRNSVDAVKKAEYDYCYAKRVSFLFDAWLVLLTVYTVIKHTGINAGKGGTDEQ